MESAGVILDEPEEESGASQAPARRKAHALENMSIPNLEKMLEEALSKEEYEKAAKIRDVINSKKGLES
jgi:protein-arginine kinase activator protein McsA